MRQFHAAQTQFRAALGVAIAMVVASIAPAAGVVSLSWRLVGNQLEGGYKAELTIRNDGSQPLKDDWNIYFNSSSRLLPESVAPDYELRHINGDFYSLSPGKQFTSIPPGGSDIVAWKGAPWAINISDAPSGFYIVPGDRSGAQGKPIPLNLQILPFPEADQLRRGADDVEPVVTAESRFNENEALSLLPADELVPVVPTPVVTTNLPGEVSISKTSAIFYEPELENEAQLLAKALAELLGSEIPMHRATRDDRSATGTISLRIGEVQVAGKNKKQGDEAYQLTAAADRGIEIVGSDAAGIFYGVQTLRALLPIAAYREPAAELKIGAVQIDDAPRFRYRGVHLDVARNFQSKETVRRLLDLMAFYKLNRFHWHLTDDEGWRVEIRQLPELTQVGGRRGHPRGEADYLPPSYGSGPDPQSASSSGSGYYTRSDMVEILRYATERHIRVIPEIDLPGHSRAAIKAMEARNRRMAQDRTAADGDSLLMRDSDDESKYESVQMWRDNVVDVGRDETYRFVQLIVDELAAVYNEAGVALTSVHLGGDEVPDGVWGKSPACANIPINANSQTPRRGQLELHFLNRASELLAQQSIQPACWEDCLLFETDDNAHAGDARCAAGRPTPTAYVWNNVWGWGREDAAYRLANAGFDVVLCNATHLYFDLACEKDPHEPGYYWAGFVDARKPFEFVPLDVFQNADRNTMGQPVTDESLAGRTRLTDKGASHVLGIQGELWGENLRTPQNLAYMAFPRMIALAERAWASSPHWASIERPDERRASLERDWNHFANRLGQRELPRLDWFDGGVHYRLPPPGALVRDGLVRANAVFPGLEIRYTSDGSEPTKTASLYRESIRTKGEIRLKTFDQRGRSSRAIVVRNASE